MPAFSAGLPVRTELTSTPSVSRLVAAPDVVIPMTACGWPIRDIRYGPGSIRMARGGFAPRARRRRAAPGLRAISRISPREIVDVRPVSHARWRTRVYRATSVRVPARPTLRHGPGPRRPPSVAQPHAPRPPHLPSPLAGRGGRGVPVPASRRRGDRPEEERPVSAPRRGRGPARRDLGAAASRTRRRPRDVPAECADADSRRAWQHVRAGISAADAARGRGARGQELPRHAPAHGAGRARRGGVAAARARIGRARDDAQPHRRKDRRAVAPHGVRRLSAQRRLRIQRRTDGELRSRRRRDRRVGARPRITR